MQTIKYPIKEVDISTIPENKMLSLGITKTQKLLCEKSIRQYGLLTPIVLLENESGELTTLTGENELEILKEMSVDKIDAFVTHLKNRSDSGKMILLLSSFRNGLNPISEGLLLRQLLKVGAYTQKELAETLMKSKSWVSKRLTLAEQLNDQVSEMVLSKNLCPGSACEIARLPKEVQLPFATRIIEKDIPKSGVERLVVTYNSKETPESLKQSIIERPHVVVGTLMPQHSIRPLKQKSQNDDSKKLDGSLRLLLSLISEIEVYLAGMNKEEAPKYQKVLPIIQKACSRFLSLIDFFLVSCGKPIEENVTKGGETYGNH